MRQTAKDRLISALAAQLRAERDTREALRGLIEAGGVDREAMLAILSDPVPVLTRADLDHADRLASRMRAESTRRTGLRADPRRKAA
jgi:hypothetical protein